MKMAKIIFLILPFFVFNFYYDYFYSTNTNKMDLKTFQRIDNEYVIIYINDNQQTIYARVDAKTLDVITYGRLFEDEMKYFIILGKNVYCFIFSNYLIINNNGKEDRVNFGDEHHKLQDQIYNGNSILIGTFYRNDIDRYNAELYLFKEPYNEISKNLIIDNTQNFKLIGLKDYFIFIKIDDEESNTKNQVKYTYYIFDLNLDIKNSLTYKYANYREIKFSELSENNKINEFIMCISYYKSIIECRIITCKNSHLTFSNSYQIFSEHDINNTITNNTFSLYINIFDEDKIGCYLLSNEDNFKYDYVTIMHYNNSHLYYYKNISDCKFEAIRDYAKNNKKQIIKINNNIGILTSFRNIHFIYFYSVYLNTTISLKVNEKQNEFPIKEFIYPGIEPLFHFSFYEMAEGLTIYKNLSKIEKEQVFIDLNNFTYRFKIENYSENSNFTIKIKDHENDHIYEININITLGTIRTYKETHKCLKSISYDKINNIKYSNLYNVFQVSNTTDPINLTFYMESKPSLNELVFYLIFYLNNITLKCTYDLNNIITCKIPLIIIPLYENINVYSYLSCYNLIYVGWFEIYDMEIPGKYDLLSYDFYFISEIYDPSEKITEYNSKMINYYYWFSCLVYSDNFGKCGNILSKWKIVFSKEYSYNNEFTSTIKNLLKDSSEIKMENNELSLRIFLIDIIKDKNKEIDKIPLKGLSYMKLFTTAFLTQLLNIFYRYNFIILKSDEYKKIVVAFPGITYRFQLLEELIHAGMVALPIKEKNKVFRVSEMYNDIFTLIENDLFNNLNKMREINDKDYQVIFTGHSLGGAIATISSFYYIKKYKFEAENILITFGQPKVGNELFAKELTNNFRQI